MFVHSVKVAAVFSQIADLLAIKGDNPFRIRAYRNVARMLNSMAIRGAVAGNEISWQQQYTLRSMRSCEFLFFFRIPGTMQEAIYSLVEISLKNIF